MQDHPLAYLKENILDDLTAELADKAPNLETTLNLLESLANGVIDNLKGEPLDCKAMGIDPRAGRIYTNPEKDVLITENGFSEYYSGFSYVEAYHVRQFGRFKIWSPESSRIAEHLGRINPSYAEEQEEDEEQDYPNTFE